MEPTENFNDSTREGTYLPAPHSLRALAWLVDGAIVMGIFTLLPQPVYYLVFLVLLVSYHTISIWLVQQTIGKALVGLEVKRIGKNPGFFWALGRSSLGYFIVDVLGVGVLAAMFTRRHQCLHDYVFDSFVIYPGINGVKPNAFILRLIRFAERQAKAVEEKKKPLAILGVLWAFLVDFGKTISKAIDWLDQLGSGTSARTAAPSIAEALSLKAAASITLVTMAITGAVVTKVPIMQDATEWLIRPRYYFMDPSGVFDSDKNILAKFEFDGNVLDSSHNKSHARLLGGEFVKTSWGQGLHISSSAHVGIDWSDHAHLLVHPYTIEIVLTPRSTTPWGKLFSFDDSNDDGWYYKKDGIQAYPHAVLGSSKIRADQQHYLAFVSTGPRTTEVYFQGERLGSTQTSFDLPPIGAIFFRDDLATNRREQVDAVVEEMRISKISRTRKEIKAVQNRLEARSNKRIAGEH